jgi:hypothetical protein
MNVKDERSDEEHDCGCGIWHTDVGARKRFPTNASIGAPSPDRCHPYSVLACSRPSATDSWPASALRKIRIRDVGFSVARTSLGHQNEFSRAVPVPVLVLPD